jgi:hypothetical protein
LILYTNGLRVIRYDFYRKAVLVNIPLYRVEQGTGGPAKRERGMDDPPRRPCPRAGVSPL